jgi:hypothetical protein
MTRVGGAIALGEVDSHENCEDGHRMRRRSCPGVEYGQRVAAALGWLSRHG